MGCPARSRRSQHTTPSEIELSVPGGNSHESLCIDNDLENMGNYKVGDRVQVKASGGRNVQAPIKAVVETTEGVRLQVSFGEDTALIYPWQIVVEARGGRLQRHRARNGVSESMQQFWSRKNPIRPSTTSLSR
jgi:hypothetical protein